MKLVLLVTPKPKRGPGISKVMGGTGNFCTIGRLDCVIRLADPMVSRAHAVLYAETDGTLWVRDLKSKNGTLVDGETISKHQLAEGDAFQVGTTTIEVLSFEPAVSLPNSNQGHPLDGPHSEVEITLPDGDFASGLEQWTSLPKKEESARKKHK